MMWRTINNLLNKTIGKKELPTEFLLCNSPETTSNPVEIANKFNDLEGNVAYRVARR